ncbi:hypothetical protein GCM10009609_12220 [Pseudonocardia aurantiaca]|uniref:Uncharacterized protein n=1 Tax=Pseudonocardia aurantiaca TaxID=75290 RepID=A0ABW4FD99_9PSEU
MAHPEPRARVARAFGPAAPFDAGPFDPASFDPAPFDAAPFDADPFDPADPLGAAARPFHARGPFSVH